MNKNVTELFCFVDDFCKAINKNFAEKLLPNSKKPTRTPGITHSEILTIILLYQQSRCEDFKSFYTYYLKALHGSEFQNLPTYSRFIRLKSRVLWYLVLLLKWLCEQSKMTGISYIDATSIAVCHPKRISRNKVFKGLAKLGKTTYGWFLGFKLHMVINEKGEIQGVTMTKGNVDDRKPVPKLTEKLTGLLFGDKGYIKKELFAKLFDRGIKLVTKVKKGMKNTLMLLEEKIFLRKRSIIQTGFGYLKNRLDLEHSRHRSPINFLVHIFSTLVSYSMKPKKPSISRFTVLINPQLGFPKQSFDFLGYTFRPRLARNKIGKHFVSFLPAISNKAKKKITTTIRSWKMLRNTHITLEEISGKVNPIVRGWYQYYGKFYRTEVYKSLKNVERHLEKWVKRKYKRLRSHGRLARQFLGKVRDRSPNIFYHWTLGLGSKRLNNGSCIS